MSYCHACLRYGLKPPLMLREKILVQLIGQEAKGGLTLALPHLPLHQRQLARMTCCRLKLSPVSVGIPAHVTDGAGL